MLSELRIQNFAIIDRLEVSFAPGFNVITGETGAGKSIIIDAVDLMLGGRADMAVIRAGRDKAVVEGVFRPAPRLMDEIRPLLDAEGIDSSGADPATPEVTFTREIRSNGRNVCRINGSTVSLQFYREIGEKLVDIHGQTEHLSLLRQKEHINLLDRYAALEAPRAEIAALVREVKGIREQIEELEQDEAALARRIDMLNYQIEEIRAVAPQIGEEEALRDESARLANAEQLAALTGEAVRLLDGEEQGFVSAVELMSQIAAALAKVARLDPNLAEQADLAESLEDQLEEMARELRRYNENIEHNPLRLNEVEDRLDAISRLKRKYGGSIEAVLEYSRNAQKELNTITNSEERLAELRAQEEAVLRKIGEQAAMLSAARQEAARRLSACIEAELNDLRMEGTRFEVLIEQQDDPAGCFVGEKRLSFDATGVDRVEFLMAANRGEPLRPLVKVASGGETARIMLALKSVLSRADPTPTLIFDEIDQGIGGRVGTTVGQKLWKLAENHQVLCVTHLAQLAGFGDSHFKVTKSFRDDRTVTSIAVLQDRARVEEIAEMLGSETESTRQSAQEILTTARLIKEDKGIQTPLL